MSRREELLIAPYAAHQMFDLVLDIERYPEFVPGYLEARVLRREEGFLFTRQKVGFGAISATFHSQANYERDRFIEIRSLERPFEFLEIQWSFQPLPNGSRIGFRAEATLGKGVASRLLQPWFDHLAAFVPTAFLQRAHALYGERAGSGPGPR